MHQRLHPRRHRFAYDLFWFVLTLADDAPSTPTPWLRLGWQWRGWPGYGFYQQDHLPGLPGTLRQRLATVVADQTGMTLPPDGQIRGVTQCRVLGYGFNPVSFWFCADRHGQPLAIVAEVQNTFLEVKPYVLTPPPDNPQHAWWRLTVPKQFYVSPFLSVTDWFDFRLRWLADGPSARMAIAIHTLDGQTRQPQLVSTFTGSAQVLTTRSLWQQTIRHPWMPLWVIGLIHWHAVRLWLKRIPFFAKDAALSEQTGRLRPR
jgi:uncharacterized protein